MNASFSEKGLRCVSREESLMSLASSKSSEDSRLISRLSSLNFDAPPEPPTVELRVDCTSDSIIAVRVPSRNNSGTVTHSHPTPFPYIPSPKTPPPLFRPLDDVYVAIPSSESFMAFSPSDSKMVSPTRILRKNLRSKFLREASTSNSAMSSSDYDLSILPPTDFGEKKHADWDDDGDDGKDAKEHQVSEEKEFRTRRVTSRE